MSRPASPIADLDRAIAAKEFKPYLQPTVDLATGEYNGAEMLARWVKPDGTVISMTISSAPPRSWRNCAAMDSESLSTMSASAIQVCYKSSGSGPMS
jgi:hypothetical protein